MSQIESTYKDIDVEEPIDVYFYRPLGYAIAKGCSRIGVTPNLVTIASIFVGVYGGHLLYYTDFVTNAIGFLLWIIADTLDSVDGQLARMTDHKTKLGRILDGFGGNLMFMSMYLHLLARMIMTYDIGWPLLLFIVLVSSVSHSLQSSLADYYRNAYLRFVVDSNKSELDNSSELRAEYENVSWWQSPFRKVLLRLYLNYTMQQEALSRNFQVLRKRVAVEFGSGIPLWFAAAYRRGNKPLMKYYAMLTTNTRMVMMMACVLSDHVMWYFAGEIIALNLLMVLVTRHQEQLSAFLLQEVNARRKHC